MAKITEVFDLQRFRKDVGATQQQLSNLLSAPQSFISQVENRRCSMPPAWKDTLAAAFNITDISEYVSITDGQNNFTNTNGVAGVGINVSNDLDKLLGYLQSHDLILSEQLKRKDDIIMKSQQQIDRLIGLLEKQ